MDTHDAQTAPAMLSEDELASIERSLARRSFIRMPEVGQVAAERLAAHCRAQAQTIAALSEENFALAAHQCIVDGGLVGDEGGSSVCTLRAEVTALSAEVKRRVADGCRASAALALEQANRDAAEARAAELGAQVQRLAEALADAVPALRIVDTLWHHLPREQHMQIVNAYNKASAALPAPSEAPAEADTLADLRSLAWRLATALDGAANCARLVERHTTAEGLLHALRLSITAADRVLPDARAAGLLVDDGAGLLTNASEGGER